MTIFKRTILFLLFCSAAAVSGAAENEPATASGGPYKPTWESLAQHQEAPEWFRDAKFGIYFHWGVYSVPAFGSEWYPRNMHLKNRPEYKHHLETYGSPLEFGYDKFVPKFRAEHFDADRWADLFQKAGARFAGPVAEHHDGFSMWDSELTPWNAKDRGPKKDITGRLADAIRQRGMRFVATFHHARNNLWKEDGHWTGHYSGVKKNFPEALEDPERAILYGYMPRDEFLEMWLGKLKEVIDQYQPDLMWFDSWLDEIPDEYQKEYLAYYFNHAARRDKGVGVTFKQNDLPRDVALDDYEKGRADKLTEFAWLTDDTISRGSWCYTENLTIKPLREVLHVLIDIVSKNGQLLLNISPKANGIIPRKQKDVLLGLGEWLKVNGEAIYGTRPWVIYGEGPTRMRKGGHFVGSVKYSSHDIRFTTDGDVLYAIFLGEPAEKQTIACLGTGTGLCGGAVSSVSLLGVEGELDFEQDEEGLHVSFPETFPAKNAAAIKIEGLKLVGFEPEVDKALLGGLWQTEKPAPKTIEFEDGKAVLAANDAALTGSGIGTETRDDGQPNIGYWDNPSEYATWKVDFPKAGTYAVSGRFAALKQGTFHVQVGEATLKAQSPVTGSWGHFENKELGMLKIDEAGPHEVHVRPVARGWPAMNLSCLELERHVRESSR